MKGQGVDDGTLLEYVLPMEGGRRPDVLVLENGIVVILEFKGRERWDISDVDQAIGYKRPRYILFVRWTAPCTRYFGHD